jgi:hypothetical protein
MKSYKRSPSDLCAIGIDVERLAVPGYPLGLDLKTLGVSIPMTVDCDCSSDGNHSFLQACPLRPGRRSQRKIPDLAIRSADLHCGMRSSEAKASEDGAGNLEFLIQIPTPAVMGRCWNSRKRKCEDARPTQSESLESITYLSFTGYDTPLSRAAHYQQPPNLARWWRVAVLRSR